MKNGAIFSVLAIALNACSTRPSTLAPVELDSSQNTSIPAPVVAGISCPDLSGSYQMDSDEFTLKQEGCGQISRVTSNQDAVVYNVNDPEVEINSSTGSFFEKFYFDGNQFVQQDRFVNSMQITEYSLTSTPCGLVKSSGLYLMAQSFTNGQATGCHFWLKI